MFHPQTKYKVTARHINLRDFAEYPEDYVVRPPYQRKSVWSRKKKLDLLDSLFRRFYVPKIVIREVQLAEEEVVNEIIDGQQRIAVAQEFYRDKLPLPGSLADMSVDFPGKVRSQLPVSVKRFVDKKFVYDADIVSGIEDPRNPEHQQIAAEIFWRLQQGEMLTYMEVAHARLSSLPRNFVVKYADDIGFDYDCYQPVDENPSKHSFFGVIDRNNNRMQHLALLTRLLILEAADGPADIKNTNVMEFIEQGQQNDGVGNLSYEEAQIARSTLSNMTAFHQVFRNDPLVKAGGAMKEFSVEYFIISFYLLLRHLRKHYVFGPKQSEHFRRFTIAFHEQWRAKREETEILLFSDHRQQSANDIEIRHRIVRHRFFEYVKSQGSTMVAKDTKRAFSEAERIAIYRRDKGLCQQCKRDGATDEEALVPWAIYDADHVVPHSKGGATDLKNAQVLCHTCNLLKGNQEQR